MVIAMNKSVAGKSGSKGNLAHKYTGEVVIPKAKAGPGAVRERSAVSGRYVEAVRRPAPMRRTVSEYTRQGADWLNSLVRSVAKDAINRG